MGVRIWGDQGCSGERDCNCKYCVRVLQKTSTRNNNHLTKQTIQKGRGDVLNKDLDSVRSVESKTGDLNLDVEDSNNE